MPADRLATADNGNRARFCAALRPQLGRREASGGNNDEICCPSTAERGVSLATPPAQLLEWYNEPRKFLAIEPACNRELDIEYFYTSRLPGEPIGGVDDFHLHSAEPRTFRATFSSYF